MHGTSSRIRAASPRQEVFGFASGHSRVPVMAAAHRHDDVELVLPLGGSATLQHGGRSYEVAAGTGAVFWAGLPHRLTGTTGRAGRSEQEVSVGWLTVPLVDVLAGAAAGTSFLAGLLRGQLWCLAAPENLTASMALWWQESGAGTRLSPAARLEAEGCLVRVAQRARVSDVTSGPPPAGSGTAATATAMAAWISEHFRGAVRVDDVAASVHLHPSTARSVFRRQLGVTIGDYLGQCRTAEAQRLLMSTDATTTEIAHRAGFGSTSRFYARFVHDVGTPPAAYRRLMRG